MAGIRLRVLAGRLRARISAGSRGIPRRLSALGMAATVFHRWVAGAAHAIRASKGERARGLAPVAHRLDNLPASDIWELEAFCLSRGAHGDGKFHLSRHPGDVPNLFGAAARF